MNDYFRIREKCQEQNQDTELDETMYTKIEKIIYLKNQKIISKNKKNYKRWNHRKKMKKNLNMILSDVIAIIENMETLIQHLQKMEGNFKKRDTIYWWQWWGKCISE